MSLYNLWLLPQAHCRAFFRQVIKRLVCLVCLLSISACSTHYSQGSSKGITSAMGVANKTLIGRNNVYVFPYNLPFYIAYPMGLGENTSALGSRYYYQLNQVLVKSFSREFPNTHFQARKSAGQIGFSYARQKGAAVVVRPILTQYQDRVNSTYEWRQHREIAKPITTGYDRISVSLELYDAVSEQLIDTVTVNSRSSIFTTGHGSINKTWRLALDRTLRSLNAH